MYKPPSQSDNEFTNRLSLINNYFSPKYENLILNYRKSALRCTDTGLRFE